MKPSSVPAVLHSERAVPLHTSQCHGKLTLCPWSHGSSSSVFRLFTFRGAAPSGGGSVLYGSGMQVPFFGNRSYYSLFCHLGEPLPRSVYSPFELAKQPCPSLPHRMIDPYFTREVGERMCRTAQTF